MDKLKKLEEAILFADTKIKNAPEGKLYIKKIGDVYRYYYQKSSKLEKLIYLGEKDSELIRKLQEKDYYIKLKSVAESELKAQKEIQKIESSIQSYEHVFIQLPENKRTMISPYVSKETEEIKTRIEKECKTWKKETFVRKGVEKNISLVTLNGERVRSKSELIIADRLKNAGIPYCYERKYVFEDDDLNSKKKAFDLDYDVWFPDFQAINTRTGELFFWEHFGLMDNPEYCASCEFKLETYSKHGIFMGKNLIVTMESSKHTLNVEYVDRLINEFLK